MAKRSKRAGAVPDDRLKVSQTGVVVRMYRHGLGDCFLLGLPGRGGAPCYLLIDCGVLLGTPNAAAKMREVVEDISAAVGGYLQILVATNEHWDHLSGFFQAKELFEKLRIDEVWLPWTEDPNDALAHELRGRRLAGRQGLTLARRLLKKEAPGMPDRARRPASSSSEGGPHRRSSWSGTGRGPPAYPGAGDAPFSLPGVDDVRFYVLGPPGPQPVSAGMRASRAPAADNPAEAFFAAVRAASQAGPRPSDAGMPFDAALGVSVDEAAPGQVLRRTVSVVQGRGVAADRPRLAPIHHRPHADPGVGYE